METKAHKKKIKKKMPRRVKKRRKVQTDDVRNLFKLLQVALFVCRHAIRCAKYSQTGVTVKTNTNHVGVMLRSNAACSSWRPPVFAVK